MIKPTVGRKVWYRPNHYDKQGRNGMAVSGDAPLDATIIAVWGDRCINVLVTDIMGKQFPLTSITLVQEGDAKPLDYTSPVVENQPRQTGGYVEWMPYQTAQAKAESHVHTAPVQADVTTAA